MAEIKVVGIYILPTQGHSPPKAVLLEHEPQEVEGGRVLEGILSEWSSDMGCWQIDGMPLPSELGEMITQRAKELGVEW